FFFQAEDGIRDYKVTGVQTCALPISKVDKLDFNEGQPLKFRAVFEVMPEFELGSYKGLELEMPTMDITEKDVEKALEEMRERAEIGRASCRERVRVAAGAGC